MTETTVSESQRARDLKARLVALEWMRAGLERLRAGGLAHIPLASPAATYEADDLFGGERE